VDLYNLVRSLLEIEVMTTEDVVWLVVTGAALGVAARFFLALDIRLHTAIYGGVLALLIGPWVAGHLGAWFADWTTRDIVVGAVLALVLASAVRFALIYARRQYFKRHRPGGRQV
jgi:hypothetical protein